MKTVLKAVVLLSGGLDSSVAMAIVQQTHDVVLALTVDYGQRAFKKELVASQVLAAHMKVPHQVIELPWLKTMLPTGMQVDGIRHVDLQEQRDPVASVWVPNRNGVLLNIAAAYAEALQAQAVVFGANADEGRGFPDNTDAYRVTVTQALAFSTRCQVEVLAPLAFKTKQEIITLGRQLGLPLEQTWSCYEAEETPCGVCLSCRNRTSV